MTFSVVGELPHHGKQSLTIFTGWLETKKIRHATTSALSLIAVQWGTSSLIKKLNILPFWSTLGKTG
jgi:hypothetical protein